MKYQIQKVKKDDHSDREVIAEKDGLMTQDEINSWFSEQSKDVQLEESHQLFPVPETHGWFKASDPDASIGSATVDVSRTESTDLIPVDKAISFAEVAQAELKASNERRKKEYQEDQQFRKAVARIQSS